MRKPDFLVPIAVWEFLTAFGALMSIVGLLGFLSFFPAWTVTNGSPGIPRVGTIGIVFLVVLAPVFLAYLVLSITAGVMLLQGRETGRIMSIVHSGLSLLFLFPVGTVIGALILVYLTRPEVRGYFEGSSAP